MKQILAILILLIGVITAEGQYQNVMISNTGSPEEVTICINPKNPLQVVAGCNINHFYWSTNGGLTWSPRGTLTSSLYGVWGDPCLIVDTNGVFYYFHLSNPTSGGHWIDRIVCQKSTNAGVSWNNPGSYTFYDPNKDQDKEWAVVDFRNNHIYCTWTQFDNYGSSSQLDSSNILFAKSTDGGNTWVAVKRINQLGGDCVDEDNTTEGAVPAVGPNGEVYVAWSGPKIRNQQFGIFFDKSTDGGNTFLQNDIYVTDQPGGWDFVPSGIYRANGMPVTCCDVSNGPYRGTIYINYCDEVTSTDRDVKLVKSTNGGLNWSTPLRVNQDPPGREQFFTWMTVDRVTGYVYIIYYDRRNTTGNATDVYIARSTNGGASFTETKISSTPFTPSASTFIGDYNCIDAYNNIVRPIWTRLDGSALSIYTAIIDFTTSTTVPITNLPKSFALGQNYPNPFNPVTKIKYEVPPSKSGDLQFVQIIIYDITGKEVTKIVDGLVKPGTYEAEWNGAGFSSGTYFYKLVSGDFSESKKMILIR
jgi:hypothetical protein